MAGDYFGIHELSKLFGITPESIRKYEDKGIITSIRDSQNGYRRYSAWELFDLLYVRAYRESGFTLKQTSELIGTKDPTSMLENIDRRQHDILSEMERLKKQMFFLNKWGREIREISAQGESLRIETFPETRFFPLMRVPAMEVYESEPSVRDNWLNSIPYTSVTAYFLDDNLLDHMIGLSVSSAEEQLFGLNNLKAETVLPSSLCFTCALEANKDIPVLSNQLKRKTEEIKKQGYTLVGPVVYKGCYYGKVNGQHSAVSKYYFPVSLI